MPAGCWHKMVLCSHFKYIATPFLILFQARKERVGPPELRKRDENKTEGNCQLFVCLLLSCLPHYLRAWNRLLLFALSGPFGNMGLAVACSQTLYFLFKVRRAQVIKYKPRGICANVFEKNEKKTNTTSVYRPA